MPSTAGAFATFPYGGVAFAGGIAPAGLTFIQTGAVAAPGWALNAIGSGTCELTYQVESVAGSLPQLKSLLRGYTHGYYNSGTGANQGPNTHTTGYGGFTLSVNLSDLFPAGNSTTGVPTGLAGNGATDSCSLTNGSSVVTVASTANYSAGYPLAITGLPSGQSSLYAWVTSSTTFQLSSSPTTLTPVNYTGATAPAVTLQFWNQIDIACAQLIYSNAHLSGGQQSQGIKLRVQSGPNSATWMMTLGGASVQIWDDGGVNGLNTGMTLTNCTVTHASPVVTMASTAGLHAGDPITGSGTQIAAGTTIQSVDSTTQITMTHNWSASSSTTTTLYAQRNYVACPRIWTSAYRAAFNLCDALLAAAYDTNAALWIVGLSPSALNFMEPMQRIANDYTSQSNMAAAGFTGAIDKSNQLQDISDRASNWQQTRVMFPLNTALQAVDGTGYSGSVVDPWVLAYMPAVRSVLGWQSYLENESVRSYNGGASNGWNWPSSASPTGNGAVYLLLLQAMAASPGPVSFQSDISDEAHLNEVVGQSPSTVGDITGAYPGYRLTHFENPAGSPLSNADITYTASLMDQTPDPVRPSAGVAALSFGFAAAPSPPSTWYRASLNLVTLAPGVTVQIATLVIGIGAAFSPPPGVPFWVWVAETPATITAPVFMLGQLEGIAL